MCENTDKCHTLQMPICVLTGRKGSAGNLSLVLSKYENIKKCKDIKTKWRVVEETPGGHKSASSELTLMKKNPDN